MRPYHSNRLPPGLNAELLADGPLAAGTLNLTESNPTRCALEVVVPLILDQRAMAAYCPEALGPLAGREAVAQCLQGWGRPTSAHQVMLTCSTSEALSYVFKLACSPGDTVACGVPGYPLVPHLAELEGLQVASFALVQGQDGAWQVDLADVQRVLQQGAAAVVLVSPGNPTGVCLDAASTQALAQLCNRHQALAVFDEVFAPYHGAAPHARLVDVSPFERAICLGGLSKAALLPQAKISWLTVHGTKPFVAAALSGLEWIGDSYLPVGVTALALAPMLRAMPLAQAALRTRIAHNHRALQALWQHHGGAAVDPYTAGWYAVVRPHGDGPVFGAAEREGVHVAQHLLQHAGVNLQPGYLYDLPGAHTLVASLIVPPSVHAQGWQRVAHHLGR